MATTPSPLPGASSAVCTQFLEPLRAVHDLATTIRQCPAESDWDWLTKGVDRVLSNGRSGRDFLQTFQMFWSREVQVGPYFETLASARRLGMVPECSALLRRRVDALRLCPLSPRQEGMCLAVEKKILGHHDDEGDAGALCGPRAQPAVDLYRAPAFHAGDVQTHPLAAGVRWHLPTPLARALLQLRSLYTTL